MQITRSGALKFIKTYAEYVATDYITAMYSELVGRSAAVARINVVVKSASTGHALYEKMHFVSTKSCVRDWKVMNPHVGSTGPDSAVIYLCEALNSASAIKLIAELDEVLKDDL